MMTVEAVVDEVRVSAETVELPERVKAWPELDGHRQIGFRGREAVSIAASFFDRVEVGEQWMTGDANLVKRVGVDGETVFVDPLTGELFGPRPQQTLRTVDRSTGEVLERGSREVGRRWRKTDPSIDGPWTIQELFDNGVPSLPVAPQGYSSAGPITELVFRSPTTGRIVDTRNCRSELADEKRAAPLEHSVVISPGTVQLKVTDPRDSTDPALVFDDGEGPPVTREPITEFSRKSKNGMIKRCLSIPWGDYIGHGERLWMITLTAPGQNWEQFLGEHSQAYKAVRRFDDRVSYHTGKPNRMFWHLEFQDRGAPHWHCLIVLPIVIKDMQVTEFVSKHWFEAVGSGQGTHLQAGTRVELDESFRFIDPKRASLYFAGYSTGNSAKDKDYQFKVPQGWADETGSVGRWWGKFGVTPAEEEARITDHDLIEAKRLIRAHARAERGAVAAEELSPERRQAWDRKGRKPGEDGRYVLPLMGKPRRRNRGAPRSLRRDSAVGSARHPDETRCVFPEIPPESGPDYQPTRPSRRRQYIGSFKGTAAGCTVFLNDGPGFAVNLARHLSNMRGPVEEPAVGLRGTARDRLEAKRKAALDVPVLSYGPNSNGGGNTPARNGTGSADDE